MAKGFVASVILITNTLFWSVWIYVLALLKLIVPVQKFRDLCTRRMVRIGETWIATNSRTASLLHEIRWNVEGIENLDPGASYLVLSNHQSWVDIVVLQHVLNRKIPFLRFFLKRELLYVPFLGLTWWALDFPFMRRYSREFLEKHPEFRGRDLETTRRACERFRGSPTSILNFVEGTRATPEKRTESRSPYRFLLPPKAGGVAFVLQTMGSQFQAVLDVTIHYPEGQPTLWRLLSGRVNVVNVRVRTLPVPPELIGGNYLEEDSYRARVQTWVREIWQAKDEFLATLTRNI